MSYAPITQLKLEPEAIKMQKQATYEENIEYAKNMVRSMVSSMGFLNNASAETAIKHYLSLFKELAKQLEIDSPNQKLHAQHIECVKDMVRLQIQNADSYNELSAPEKASYYKNVLKELAFQFGLIEHIGR